MSQDALTTASGRIAQIDVLRGFAVLGIFWIGVAAFGLPYGANALPTLLGTASPLNLACWAFTEVFMEGAMRGLFSILFGASALIFLSEARLGAAGLPLVDRFYRRNLLLMLFGMVHAYLLLWPHDVLFAYGLIGMFLFPLRGLPPWVLFLAGFALQAVARVEVDWATLLTSAPDLLDAAAGGGPDPEQGAAFTGWLRAQMEQDLQLYRSGYLDIFVAQAAEAAAQESTLLYQRHVFEIGGMMLIGMALLRWGVLSGERSGRFYAALMVLGYLVGGWMRGQGVYAGLVNGFDPVMLAEMERENYDLGRLPMALGHIGLIGLICRAGGLAWLTRALAATGRLALTHYLSQSALAITLFYGFGFGLFGTLERYQLAMLCVAVWVVQIGFSLLWLRRFRLGPLEWVWRSLVEGRAQPLRLRLVSVKDEYGNAKNAKEREGRKG